MMQPDLQDIGTKMDVVRHRLSVAKEDLDAAKPTFDAGQYRAANNRAYYAIFHAIYACLTLEGKAFKTHAQVIGNFNKDFIHTGKFPGDWAKKLKQAENIRESCDYEAFYIVSISETERQLKTASEIVKYVEMYIQEQRIKADSNQENEMEAPELQFKARKMQDAETIENPSIRQDYLNYLDAAIKSVSQIPTQKSKEEAFVDYMKKRLLEYHSDEEVAKALGTLHASDLEHPKP